MFIKRGLTCYRERDITQTFSTHRVHAKSKTRPKLSGSAEREVLSTNNPYFQREQIYRQMSGRSRQSCALAKM